MEPFDLYSPVIDADPFPYYAALRDQYPCYWSDGAKLWIISRCDDVVEAALIRKKEPALGVVLSGRYNQPNPSG